MKLFLKKDAVIITLLLLVSVILFLFFKTGSGSTYEISVGKDTVISGNLIIPKTHTLDNGVVIECRDGKVRFLSSDCPDKVCVLAGDLKKDGDWAACLPNLTFLEVVKE